MKILFILIVCLIIVYLFQVEALIKDSYFVEAYQREIKTIRDRNLSLEVQPMEKVENQVQTLGFVKTSTIKYIPISFEYSLR